MTSILVLGDIESSHLKRWLPVYDEMGFDIILADYRVPSKNKDINGHQIVGAPQGLKFKFLKMAFLFFKLKFFTRTPNIVHSYYLSTYGLIGAFIQSDKRYVSVWGSDVLLFPKKSSFHKILSRFILNKYETVFCTSKSLYNAVVNIGVPSEECKVIPYGIPKSELGKSPYKHFESDNGTVKFGWVKDLKDVYNQEIVLEALKIVSDVRDVELEIYGDGPNRTKLEQLATQLGIEDLVHFNGRVNHSDIENCFNNYDITINVSKSESFGVSVLESYAYGNPAILSDSQGLKDLFEGYEAALFYPLIGGVNDLAELMIYAIDNAGLMNDMLVSGRSCIKKHYLWEDNVASYKSFLNSI